MNIEIQAVLDAAAELAEGQSDETQMEAIVPLGLFQDLQNMVDLWRASGGLTTDEMDAVIPGQVSFRPCQSCHCPEWLHGEDGPCCGQNDADTGGCDCNVFTPRGIVDEDDGA